MTPYMGALTRFAEDHRVEEIARVAVKNPAEYNEETSVVCARLGLVM